MVKIFDKVTMTVVRLPRMGLSTAIPFTFQQTGNTVYGKYAGGKIRRDFLSGQLDDSILTLIIANFKLRRYSGQWFIDLYAIIGGIRKDQTGRAFEWKSRPGEFGVKCVSGNLKYTVKMHLTIVSPCISLPARDCNDKPQFPQIQMPRTV